MLVILAGWELRERRWIGYASCGDGRLSLSAINECSGFVAEREQLSAPVMADRFGVASAPSLSYAASARSRRRERGDVRRLEPAIDAAETRCRSAARASEMVDEDAPSGPRRRRVAGRVAQLFASC